MYLKVEMEAYLHSRFLLDAVILLYLMTVRIKESTIMVRVIFFSFSLKDVCFFFFSSIWSFKIYVIVQRNNFLLTGDTGIFFYKFYW